MPPMEREAHEELLNKLNDPELSATDRADALSKLRSDYNQVHEDFQGLETENNNYKEKNEDLTHANSKLFRQMGYGNPEDAKGQELKQKDEEQEFAENITISDIESKNQ